MELIKDTKIYLGESVVVYKDNEPFCLATISGGTKRNLEVLFDDCQPPTIYKRVKGRESHAYINEETNTCLYFLGEPSHHFKNP